MQTDVAGVSGQGANRPHAPIAGDIRITVPISSMCLIEDDGTIIDDPFRIVLQPGYEVTALDDAEQNRLLDGPYRINAFVRLEILGQISQEEHDFHDEAQRRQLSELVIGTLSKLSLCVRGYFSAAYAVIDRFDGSIWRRESYLSTGEPSYDLRCAHVPKSRLSTWATLLDEWPSEPDAALTLSVNYYRESLLDRAQGNFSRALVSSAIATEILFGKGNGELGTLISTRAAHLVARGNNAFEVQKMIKKLYGKRSSVVHTGKGGGKAEVDLWHQFLMHALPSVAAWGGTVAELHSALDAASFRRGDALDRLLDEDGWWAFCNFVMCLGASSVQ